MIVADTNLIAYLLLPGEHTAEAEAVFARDPAWIVPLLWRSEFRNVLGLCLRRGHMALERALAIMSKGEELFAGAEFHVASQDVLALVDASSCSAYDCEFVALARERGVPLVTSDAGILRAFPNQAISAGGFLRERP